MSLQVEVSGSLYLKSLDFQTTKRLTIDKAPERVSASDPDYGDSDGMTTNFYFRDETGNETVFQNHSKSWAKAWNEANLDIGDVIEVLREGTQKKPEWKITKVTE